MVVYVKNLVDACDTNSQGRALFRHVEKVIVSDSTVTLDFSGISNVTSSFVNSSFVELAENFGAARVKRLIKIQSANRQVAHLIKDRMAREFA